MPKLVFKPSGKEFEVDANSKILAVACKNKVDIRFSCGACRCGTCGVLITPEPDAKVSDMKPDEKDLLERLELSTNGRVRLACQTRIMEGTVTVDIDYQKRY